MVVVVVVVVVVVAVVVIILVLRAPHYHIYRNCRVVGKINAAMGHTLETV